MFGDDNENGGQDGDFEDYGYQQEGFQDDDGDAIDLNQQVMSLGNNLFMGGPGSGVSKNIERPLGNAPNAKGDFLGGN